MGYIRSEFPVIVRITLVSQSEGFVASVVIRSNGQRTAFVRVRPTAQGALDAAIDGAMHGIQ